MGKSATVNDALARVLFPRVHPRVRRKKLRFLLVSLGVGVLVSFGFGLALYLVNTSGPSSGKELPPGVEPPAAKVYRR
jgi:hypothetical protein